MSSAPAIAASDQPGPPSPWSALRKMRARIACGSVKRGEDRYHGPGRFLDLRTLAFVLSDKGHTLLSAGKAFGAIPLKEEHPEGHGVITADYVAYGRRDVAATGALLEALRREYDRHPVDLPPDKAWSPATLAKAYLTAMGVAPPLRRQPNFPRAVLGDTMAAYLGGRAECRIRRTPVPVVLVDVLSMYPSCQALLGLWPFVTAERITVEDATDEVRRLLQGVTLDVALHPDSWKELRFFALVKPAGDVLPVRAQYNPNDGAYGIGVNPFTATEARWYAGPDLVAAVLHSGRTPEVVEAFRIVPEGHQSDLRSIALRGQVAVDPGAGDFFTTVIQVRARTKRRTDLPGSERDRLGGFLKVLANSGSYGILAEQNRQELPVGKPASLTVYGLGEPFRAETTTPEDPGVYCFPPLASLITAGARLMLTLVERMVADAGGTYAFCDTDSMAIVSTQQGGLVPCEGGPHRLPDGRAAVEALSWDQVDDIVRRLDALNPYDRDAVPEAVLKIEDQNYLPCDIEGHKPDCACTKQRKQLWCLAVSAKRYALYNLKDSGEPVIRKASQHGLGHLMNPTDPDSEDRRWIEQLWEGIVREALGLPWAPPAWLGRPAVSRISASRPALLRPFASDVPYADAVKPFNFLLGAHVSPLGHPTGVSPDRFHLVAPYSRDARQWTKRRWTDVYSGARYAVTTKGATGADGVARVQS